MTMTAQPSMRIRTTSPDRRVIHELLVNGVFGSVGSLKTLAGSGSPGPVGAIRIPHHNDTDLLARGDLAADLRRQRDVATRGNCALEFNSSYRHSLLNHDTRSGLGGQFQQLGRLLRAVFERVNGDAAPCEIRHAALPAFWVTQGFVKAALVVWPTPAGLAGNIEGEAGVCGLGGAGATSSICSSCRRVITWPGLTASMAAVGKSGRYLHVKLMLPARRTEV